MMKCFAWALAASLAVAGAQAPECGVAPGYVQKGQARAFTTDNLYEYMDGNSEGYFSYGFVAMKGVTCKKGDDTLVIDISEMADPELAYGMFSANRDPVRPVEDIGTGGQVVPRRAVFVKGKYYVEVAAEPDKDHTAVLRSVARGLEKQTAGGTTRPAELTWFPTPMLKANSVRLVPQSVLGLRLLKRGYVAQYDHSKAFVVTEQSPEVAADVLGKLRQRFGEIEKASAGEEAFRGTDRYLGRLCIFRKGRYVGGFVNVSEAERPDLLAATLATRIP